MDFVERLQKVPREKVALMTKFCGERKANKHQETIGVSGSNLREMRLSAICASLIQSISICCYCTY